MAEDNVITIVIKTDVSGVAGGSKKNKEEKDPTKEFLKKVLHPVQWVEGEIFEDVNANYERFYQTVKQNVQVFANQSLNRYYNITEDYIGENYKQNFEKALNTAQNISTSVIQGAIAGGVGGAFVGAVSSVTSTIASERQRINNYYTNLNATNYQTEFNRTRSVLVDNNRNTEG